MNEIWKDIPSYDGYYQVSNIGRVRSWKNGRYGKSDKPKILKRTIDSEGYYQIGLYLSGKYKRKRVHRLVAKVFLQRSKGKTQVNHKNGIKTDNRVDNLEWVTCSENHKHAINTGLRNQSSKISDSDVLDIRALWPMGWFKQREIAEAYMIDQSHVSHIVNRKSYKQI